MKRCSTSLIIRKVQIETTMIYHFIPIMKAISKIKFEKKNASLVRVWRNLNHVHLGGDAKWYSCYEKQYVGSSKTNKHRISIWSSNFNLGIHPKELKARSQRDICTPIFIAALFIIAKTWKWTSSQDGGVGRHGSPRYTTTKLQLRYRTTISQNQQKSSWMEVWQLQN